MKKFLFFLVSGALIVGCGGKKTNRDGGVTGSDGGTITLQDSGAVDAAIVRTDSGTTPSSTCSAYPGIDDTTISPVPSSCMPRCTNATLGAFNRCTDSDCAVAALQADSTPAVGMPIGTTPIDLDCFTCFFFQMYHCNSVVCPEEATPAFMCSFDESITDCDARFEALDACIDGLADGSAEETQFEECWQTQVGACFNTGGGFLPSGLEGVDITRINRANLDRFMSIVNR